MRVDAFPAIPHLIFSAPVLSASLRRYYPGQVIRVCRACPLIANGQQSQHLLPQHLTSTTVKYCNNHNLSTQGNPGRHRGWENSCYSTLNYKAVCSKIQIWTRRESIRLVEEWRTMDTHEIRIRINEEYDLYEPLSPDIELSSDVISYL